MSRDTKIKAIYAILKKYLGNVIILFLPVYHHASRALEY